MRLAVAVEDVDGEEEDAVDDLPSACRSRGQFGKGPGKQCVECGATQTPQWREGPSGEGDAIPLYVDCCERSLTPSSSSSPSPGPKTLCNACGVRFNRQRCNKRNGGGSTGQRPQSSRPAKPSKQSASSHKEAAPVVEPPAAAAVEPRCYMVDVAPQHRLPAATFASSPNGRPLRQAATRTAAFSRPGAFPVAAGDGAR